MNLSIDFAGGTSITAEFDKAYSLSEAEKDIVPVIAEAAGISEADISVQTVSGTNEIVFKTTELTTQGDDSQLTKVTAALSEKLGATVTNSDNISGSASSDMTRDAFLSVALAAVLMLIYIVIRFKDVKFGVSAVLALCHDVAMVFVLYILLRLSVGKIYNNTISYIVARVPHLQPNFTSLETDYNVDEHQNSSSATERNASLVIFFRLKF